MNGSLRRQSEIWSISRGNKNVNRKLKKEQLRRQRLKLSEMMRRTKTKMKQIAKRKKKLQLIKKHRADLIEVELNRWCIREKVKTQAVKNRLESLNIELKVVQRASSTRKKIHNNLKKRKLLEIQIIKMMKPLSKLNTRRSKSNIKREMLIKKVKNTMMMRKMKTMLDKRAMMRALNC